MPFEMTVGLLVNDHEKYALYRAGIAPLLQAAGGAFRYDFEVARTLKREVDHEFNRVFVLRFPDRAGRDRFFADARYRAIRGEYFEKAVQHTAIIAEYDS